jgi:hypothetical protein
MPADPDKSNLWADVESGQVVRVDAVDASFAKLTVLKALPSTFSMPVADYDTVFAQRYRVIDAGDMNLPPEYRPPANAPRDESPTLDEARGETAEGVVIGQAEPYR